MRPIPKTLGGLGLVAASCLALAAPGSANVKLHSLFTDDMVLQREKPVTVWGSADAGEKITLTVGTQKHKTTAGKDGRWQIKLAPLAPTSKTTFIAQGKNKIVLNNVAVGDVWICSGQSNMRWPFTSPVASTEDIDGVAAPDIRLLMIPQKVAASPQTEFGAPIRWNVCTPESAIGFSKVSYYFGRALQQKLGVPIGLINAACNGAVAETWISSGTLLKRDDLREATLKVPEHIGPNGQIEASMHSWWQTNDPGTKANWQASDFDDSDWATTKLSGAWSNGALQNTDGVLWLRQTVQIPAAWIGHDLTFRLGAIDDRDTTYFNGQEIGEMTGWNLPRVYKVPASMVKDSRVTIAIRILDVPDGGVFGGNGSPSLQLASDSAQRVPLVDWKCKATTAYSDLKPAAIDTNGDPNQPTALFNGMIAPLAPFAARGVAWYQGESNATNAAQYRTLFPDLIRDWRGVFGAKQDGSEFGFFFVQLANYMAPTDQPIQSGWAELREAQTMALSLPRTGMATAIDIGEAGDIHPRNKEDVGKRLALAALAIEYGQKNEYSGPMFAAMKLAGNTARIIFSHANGLKTADGLEPSTFAISGEDGVWYVADAKIEGDSVVLSSEKVAKPVAVRYAWANNPNVNLVNGEGLPAVSFRTDMNH